MLELLKVSSTVKVNLLMGYINECSTLRLLTVFLGCCCVHATCMFSPFIMGFLWIFQVSNYSPKTSWDQEIVCSMCLPCSRFTLCLRCTSAWCFMLPGTICRPLCDLSMTSGWNFMLCVWSLHVPHDVQQGCNIHVCNSLFAL